MSEKLTFWMCQCGTANNTDTSKCKSCGKKKPRKLLLSSIAISLLFIFIIFYQIQYSENSIDNNENINISDSQNLFIKIHNEYRDKYYIAENKLQKNEILIDLNQELKNFNNVENWSGIITGINEMNNNGAVSIEIGDKISVYAGEAVFKGVNTLINRNERKLFDFILNSQKGDKIIFNGYFAKYDNKLVEISYTEDGSMDGPKYLFKFTYLNGLQFD